MSALIKSIKKTGNKTTTENGAVTLKSSQDSVLDFFGLGGALRNRSDADVENLFSAAYSSNPLNALKVLCYLRDIRGGQGERKTFRTCLRWLGVYAPDAASKNLSQFLEFGRWDDLFVLEGTSVWPEITSLIKEKYFAVNQDSDLFWKWLPSINTSNKEVVALAYRLVKILDVTPKQYRKTLSAQRRKLNLVESQLCSKDFSAVDYEKVPSLASLKYCKAFSRNDGPRYVNFLAAVEKGEKTIKATTLYPYDIVDKVLKGDNSPTLNALWNALPNYLKDDTSNGLVVADVSGSMQGLPMAVSISLAMYIAERNQGLFKDHFITFSTTPTLESIKGKDVVTKVRNLERANWDMFTNLEAVFQLILTHAEKNKLPEAEMPKRLYIVSDMEFDQCEHRADKTLAKNAKSLYKAAGYDLPELVFWNVNARNNQSPVKFDAEGTCLVSGCSPSILTSLLAGKIITPYDVMMNIINVPRYAKVSV